MNLLLVHTSRLGLLMTLTLILQFTVTASSTRSPSPSTNKQMTPQTSAMPNHCNTHRRDKKSSANNETLEVSGGRSRSRGGSHSQNNCHRGDKESRSGSGSGSDGNKKGSKRRGNNGKESRTTTGVDQQDSRSRRHRHADLSLWIDEQQVKLFSGLLLQIHVITDGHVQPYILDPNFEKYLPVIPSEVGVVNFTWRAGDRKYFYHFDRLQSFSEDILLPPVVSIDTRGRIPRKPKVGLLIETRKSKPLAGTPLRLRLRKECAERKPQPDPHCDKKCANGGWCNKDRVCHCPEGYMGPYCQTALCYPQCMNGGSCVAPGVCNCPHGFHGLHCEGGICGEKCLNGGKCIQKDTCDCTRGYYGLRCEYSKCMIPCLNGGRCRGVNLCRCPPNFSGDHCEIGLTNRTTTQRHICTLPCRHGTCIGPNHCQCYEGFYGRRCQRRS